MTMETMGSSGNNAKKLRNIDKQGLRPESSAVEENVQAIKRWARAILRARSKAEQVSDWIACSAGSGPVLVLHILWFGAWVTVNSGMVRRIRPFDPFPFPFLTMTVSLEAIFLALLSWQARTVCHGKPTNAATSTCRSTCSRSGR
jgi:uncharacterized membrane protein